MDLEELENHIVVCGWNRAANLLIEVLQSSEEYIDREIVLVAEFSEDEPETLFDQSRIAPAMLHIVKGDYTRMDVLQRAGIPYASEAIILADKCLPRSDQDRDARSILAALLIEKMNPEIFTCVELLNRNNAAHLNMVGVEEILVADEYAGNILANAQRTRGIIRMLDELFDPSVGNQFYKLPLPTPWIGKTVGDIYQQLKSEHGATLISLETRIGEGYDILVNPPNDRELKESDRIMMIAPTAPNFSKIR